MQNLSQFLLGQMQTLTDLEQGAAFVFALHLGSFMVIQCLSAFFFLLAFRLPCVYLGVMLEKAVSVNIAYCQ